MDAENMRVVSGEEADGDRDVAAAAALNDVGELETIVEEIAIVDGEATAIAAQDDASLHKIPDGSEPMAADGGSEPMASDVELEDAAETAARRSYERKKISLVAVGESFDINGNCYTRTTPCTNRSLVCTMCRPELAEDDHKPLPPPPGAAKGPKKKASTRPAVGSYYMNTHLAPPRVVPDARGLVLALKAEERTRLRLERQHGGE